MKNSLYHDLVTGSDVRFPGGNVESSKKLESDLKEAVVFWVDDVSDFMFEKDPRNAWDVLKDFPNIAPPFETMWLEWNKPEYMLIGDKKEYSIGPDYRMATLVKSKKVNGGFILAATSFSSVEARIAGTPGTFVLRCDEKGKPIPFGNGMAVGCITSQDEKGRFIADATTVLIGPALLAISLMHCKNVQVVERAATRQAGKRQRRRGDGIVYHTLNIEPMKRVLRTEGGLEKNGLKLAMHICRGHFKDYSQGKGLFGKFKGLFWWEDQVRGSADHGETRKDYNVKPD